MPSFTHYKAMNPEERRALHHEIIDAAKNNDIETVTKLIQSHDRHPDLFTASDTGRWPPVLYFMVANNMDAIGQLRNLDTGAFESSWKMPILEKNQALITLESDDKHDKYALQKKVKARQTIAQHNKTIYDVALEDCVKKETIACIAFGSITLPKKAKGGGGKKGESDEV